MIIDAIFDGLKHFKNGQRIGCRRRGDHIGSRIHNNGYEIGWRAQTDTDTGPTAPDFLRLMCCGIVAIAHDIASKMLCCYKDSLATHVEHFNMRIGLEQIIVSNPSTLPPAFVTKRSRTNPPPVTVTTCEISTIETRPPSTPSVAHKRLILDTLPSSEVAYP